MNFRKQIRIITGDKHGGKTTSMLKLYNEEGRRGRGIYASKIETDGIVTGYDLYDISGIRMASPFIEADKIKIQSEEDIYRQGCFIFHKKAFDMANKYLLSLKNETSIWIDEIGKLELNDKGFYEALKEVKSWDISLTLTIREIYIKDFICKYFPDKDYSLEIIYPSLT